MIEAALRYQTKGKDWVKRVLIGSGVTFLAFILFLPIFTVYGYMLEVMRRVLRGDTDTPPAWGDYDIVQLSLNGAKAFLILFAYGLVVGFVALLPAGVLFLLGAVLQSNSITLLSTLVGSALSLVSAVVIAVVAPIMIANFVIEDDLAAGFDLGVFRTFLTNRTMLRAIGLAILVNLAVSVVSSVLLVTVVGPAIVGFVGLSAVAYIWAAGFADAYREIHGELPAIPDGPTKMAGGQSAGAGADATAAGARSPTGVEDDKPTGPDPTDDERWD